MVNKRIELINNGYDPFIDELKGIAILFVLFNHCVPLEIRNKLLFDLWGGMAVPIFLLIQTFHYYKRGLNNCKAISFKRVFNRVFLPFIVAQLVIVFIKFISPNSITTTFQHAITNGGFGPGTYYIWIYLQFALLLPLLKHIFTLSSSGSVIFFLVISIILELISCYLTIPEAIYRYLFFRYFFLIYLGYSWSSKGIALNTKTICLSIISILAIVLFDYSSIDFSPFFYPSYSWKVYHWVSYFYVASVFIFIIRFLLKQVPHRLRVIIQILGKYSWEIFCCQMIVFSVFRPRMFNASNNIVVGGALYVLSTMLLSIIPAFIIHLIRTKNAKQKCLKS